MSKSGKNNPAKNELKKRSKSHSKIISPKMRFNPEKQRPKRIFFGKNSGKLKNRPKSGVKSIVQGIFRPQPL
jgi:hypothetical protein